MNLNAIAAGAVAVVNPPVIAQYRQSTGFTTDDDGTQIPTYADPDEPTVQVQPMSYRDLQQVQGLNLNGQKRAIYVNGNWRGVSRASQQGGDLITMPDGTVWMVVQELEDWFATAGWSKVAVTLQNNA